MEGSATNRHSAASGVKSRFLIIDDHPLFREALQSAIAVSIPSVKTVEARTLTEALELMTMHAPFDLVLLDLNLPGVRGFEALLHLRALYPRVPVVIVSGNEDMATIGEALSCGASGYMPKSLRKDELSAALLAVMGGAIYVPPGYEQAMEPESRSERQELLERFATLTPQQLRVLHMLREGLLNKQIAYSMNVGETTVKAHVSEILRKLNVNSRTQAVIEISRLDM